MRKLKIVNRFKKKSLYKKSLIIFSTCLCMLAIVFLVYVYKSMIIYERNLVDNYISYLAESGKLTKNINDDLFKVSSYEKSNVKITDGVKKILKSKDLEIKKNTKLSKDNIFAYDLKLKDKLISTVSLKSVDRYKRMAILTIDEWEVNDIKTYFEDGIYSYEIIVPNKYKVYVNDQEVKSTDKTKEDSLKELERLASYADIPKSTTYQINNLVYEPEIKIVDENNKEIEYKEENGKIVVEGNFQEVKELEEAKKRIKDNFDVLTLAENYSLLLTNDLQGRMTKLVPYLIPDSYMYDMIKRWSTSVDITFVSNHRLKNPVFTNEKVKNFVFYSDDAFSCEVYLEKNMVVNGEDRQDVMHDRLYFVYYEGGYKLVDMKAIKD